MADDQLKPVTIPFTTLPTSSDLPRKRYTIPFVPQAVPQQCHGAKCGCGRILVAGECPNCGYKR